MEEAANTMVNYHTTMTPILRGTVPQGTQNPQLAQPFVHLGIPLGRELCVNRKLTAMGARMQSLLPRLIVENLFCPETLDVLHQIRSKFGTVSNLFTFTKNNQFWVRLQQADRACPACQAVPGRSESLQCLLCSAHRLLQAHQSQRQIQQQEPRLHSASPAPWGQPVLAGPDHGCSIWYAQCNVSLSNTTPLSPAPKPSAAATAMAGHIAIPDLVGAKNSVLLVSNLNLERVTPQGPCILSGVYGDVQRVKILLDKENAPVQHQSVQLPREGQEEHDLTKDYSSSLLSASRSPGSKNFQIFSYPQSPFTSPISHPLFQRMTQRAADSVVKGFKFFQKDHKVALTQMGSGEEAVRR
ncbi:hypothetical protein U0070_016013 [Myodes glareolus]|uniref:Uncharacterized protein n=1 Tax=Myodes glareolus TaxID=447135 RepID=A0AAW0GUI9_MYOGA